MSDLLKFVDEAEAWVAESANKAKDDRAILARARREATKHHNECAKKGLALPPLPWKPDATLTDDQAHDWALRPGCPRGLQVGRGLVPLVIGRAPHLPPTLEADPGRIEDKD